MTNRASPCNSSWITVLLLCLAIFAHLTASTPTSQPSCQPSAWPSRKPTTQPSSQPSKIPSHQPSMQPSTAPTQQPSKMPTTQPTVQPSITPTSSPSRQPTNQPSAQPSRIPSHQPSRQPSNRPTNQPSRQPTSQPSGQPTSRPSNNPSRQPTNQPSAQPSRIPTDQPSRQPSNQPSSQPSRVPTSQPTQQPSTQPSDSPSRLPTTQPTGQPSKHPTLQPSRRPTTQPSSQPSRIPTKQPVSTPSMQPSSKPTGAPSMQPSSTPTGFPTLQPSYQPSGKPSQQPLGFPSSQPSVGPSRHPTQQPFALPSGAPSHQPTSQPTGQPTCAPTNGPSRQPTGQPTQQPSQQPSALPSKQPSIQPSVKPSAQPSQRPTTGPSLQPFAAPSCQPSSQPSSSPTTQPSISPSNQPSIQPSSHPSLQPIVKPSSQPSCQPVTGPTSQPSCVPSEQPSLQPFTVPSARPSMQPSSAPTLQPFSSPSSQPSTQPAAEPTTQPSTQPTRCPSLQPSAVPTMQPSTQPTSEPSSQPTVGPSVFPTVQPTSDPSHQPSSQPTTRPSTQPTIVPTVQPSAQPSSDPSQQPSNQPTTSPSCQPSVTPSQQPTNQPTSGPSSQPSETPSVQPSVQPSVLPSQQPSVSPSSQPTCQPSSQPSRQPSVQPSGVPTPVPSAYTSIAQWEDSLEEIVRNITYSPDVSETQLLFYTMIYDYEPRSSTCDDWNLFTHSSDMDNALNILNLKSVVLHSINQYDDDYQSPDTVTCTNESHVRSMMEALLSFDGTKNSYAAAGDYDDDLLWDDDDSSSDLYDSREGEGLIFKVECDGNVWKLKHCPLVGTIDVSSGNGNDEDVTSVDTAYISICVNCVDPCVTHCSNERYLTYISPCADYSICSSGQSGEQQQQNGGSSGIQHSIGLISFEAVSANPAPAILSVSASVTSESSAVVDVQLARAGNLYCAMFDINSYPPSSLADIHHKKTAGGGGQFATASASSGNQARLSFSSLVASTDYIAYCYSLSFSGAHMALTDALVSGVSNSITTSCCKHVKATVLTSTLTIPSTTTSSASKKLVTITLNELPNFGSGDIGIRVHSTATYANGSLASPMYSDTGVAALIYPPRTYIFTHAKPSAAFGMSKDIYVDLVRLYTHYRASGPLKHAIVVTLSGAALGDYDVSFTGIGAAAADSVQASSSPHHTISLVRPSIISNTGGDDSIVSAGQPPPPEFDTAVFSVYGEYITATFKSNIHYFGNRRASFTCSELLSFVAADQSKCLFSSANTVKIWPYFQAAISSYRGTIQYNLFNRYQALDVGGLLTVQPNKLQSDCTDYFESLSTVPAVCPGWKFSNSSVNVAAPTALTIQSGSTLIPRAIIGAPDLLGECDNLVLQLGSSVGSGGRAWENVSINVFAQPTRVEDEAAVAASLENINTFFATRYVLTPASTVSRELFVDDTTYSLTVTMCNFLHHCDSAVHVLNVARSRMPYVEIIGSRDRSIVRSESLEVHSRSFSYPSDAACGSSTERTDESLQFSWHVLVNNVIVSGIESTSVNPSIFKLPAYALDPFVTYKVRLSVLEMASGLSATASLIVEVLEQTVVASINERGERAFTLPFNEYKELDASVSIRSSGLGSVTDAFSGQYELTAPGAVFYSWSCQWLGGSESSSAFALAQATAVGGDELSKCGVTLYTPSASTFPPSSSSSNSIALDLYEESSSSSSVWIRATVPNSVSLLSLLFIYQRVDSSGVLTNVTASTSVTATVLNGTVDRENISSSVMYDPADASDSSFRVHLSTTVSSYTNTNSGSSSVSASEVVNPQDSLRVHASVSLPSFMWNSSSSLPSLSSSSSSSSIHASSSLLCTWKVDDTSIDLSSTSTAALTPVQQNIMAALLASGSTHRDRVSIYLALAANTLTAGATYTFTLQVQYRPSSTSNSSRSDGGNEIFVSSSVSIHVNDPPAFGNFSVFPTVGTELVTKFALVAFQWQDDDLPLLYSYGYYKEFSISPTFVALSGKTESATYSSYLPSAANSGELINTPAVKVGAVVTDALGASTTSGRVSTVVYADTIVRAGGTALSDGVADLLGARSTRSTYDTNLRKQYLSLAIYLSNSVTCGDVVSTANCTALYNRDGCENTENTCGPCLPNYEGVTGDGNSMCVLSPSNAIRRLHTTPSAMTRTQAEMSTTTIVQELQCTQSNCSSHGDCRIVNTNTGSDWSRSSSSPCLVTNGLCNMECSCHQGYFGQFCELDYDTYVGKLISKTLILHYLIVESELEDLTSDVVARSLVYTSLVAKKPRELTASAMKVLTYLFDTQLRSLASVSSESSHNDNRETIEVVYITLNSLIAYSSVNGDGGEPERSNYRPPSDTFLPEPDNSTMQPSFLPTSQPSNAPSAAPSHTPTSQPSAQPSSRPSMSARDRPTAAPTQPPFISYDVSIANTTARQEQVLDTLRLLQKFNSIVASQMVLGQEALTYTGTDVSSTVSIFERQQSRDSASFDSTAINALDQHHVSLVSSLVSNPVFASTASGDADEDDADDGAALLLSRSGVQIKSRLFPERSSANDDEKGSVLYSEYTSNPVIISYTGLNGDLSVDCNATYTTSGSINNLSTYSTTWDSSGANSNCDILVVLPYNQPLPGLDIDPHEDIETVVCYDHDAGYFETFSCLTNSSNHLDISCPVDGTAGTVSARCPLLNMSSVCEALSVPFFPSSSTYSTVPASCRLVDFNAENVSCVCTMNPYDAIVAGKVLQQDLSSSHVERTYLLPSFSRMLAELERNGQKVPVQERRKQQRQRQRQRQLQYRRYLEDSTTRFSSPVMTVAFATVQRTVREPDFEPVFIPAKLKDSSFSRSLLVVSTTCCVLGLIFVFSTSSLFATSNYDSAQAQTDKVPKLKDITVKMLRTGAAIPPVFSASTPSVIKYFDELLVHHRWLTVFFHSADCHPRHTRLWLLSSHILYILFFLALYFYVYVSDSHNCGRYTTERSCLEAANDLNSFDDYGDNDALIPAEETATATAAHQCKWWYNSGGSDGSGGRCENEENTLSPLRVLYVTGAVTLIGTICARITAYILLSCLLPVFEQWRRKRFRRKQEPYINYTRKGGLLGFDRRRKKNINRNAPAPGAASAIWEAVHRALSSYKTFDFLHFSSFHTPADDRLDGYTPFGDTGARFGTEYEIEENGKEEGTGENVDGVRSFASTDMEDVLEDLDGSDFGLSAALSGGSGEEGVVYHSPPKAGTKGGMPEYLLQLSQSSQSPSAALRYKPQSISTSPQEKNAQQPKHLQQLHKEINSPNDSSKLSRNNSDNAASLSRSSSNCSPNKLKEPWGKKGRRIAPKQRLVHISNSDAAAQYEARHNPSRFEVTDEEWGSRAGAHEEEHKDEDGWYGTSISPVMHALHSGSINSNTATQHTSYDESIFPLTVDEELAQLRSQVVKEAKSIDFLGTDKNTATASSLLFTSWGMQSADGSFVRSSDTLPDPQWYEIEDRADVKLTAELHKCRRKASEECRLLEKALMMGNGQPMGVSVARATERNMKRYARNISLVVFRLVFLLHTDILASDLCGRILRNKAVRDSFVRDRFFPFKLQPGMYVGGSRSLSHRVNGSNWAWRFVATLMLLAHIGMTAFVLYFAVITRSFHTQLSWYRCFMLWAVLDICSIGPLEVYITHYFWPSLIMKEMFAVSKLFQNVMREFAGRQGDTKLLQVMRKKQLKKANSKNGLGVGVDEDEDDDGDGDVIRDGRFEVPSNGVYRDNSNVEDIHDGAYVSGPVSNGAKICGKFDGLLPIAENMLVELFPESPFVDHKEQEMQGGAYFGSLPARQQQIERERLQREQLTTGQRQELKLNLPTISNSNSNLNSSSSTSSEFYSMPPPSISSYSSFSDGSSHSGSGSVPPALIGTAGSSTGADGAYGPFSPTASAAAPPLQLSSFHREGVDGKNGRHHHQSSDGSMDHIDSSRLFFVSNRVASMLPELPVAELLQVHSSLYPPGHVFAPSTLKRPLNQSLRDSCSQRTALSHWSAFGHFTVLLHEDVDLQRNPRFHNAFTYQPFLRLARYLLVAYDSYIPYELHDCLLQLFIAAVLISILWLVGQYYSPGSSASPTTIVVMFELAAICTLAMLLTFCWFVPLVVHLVIVLPYSFVVTSSYYAACSGKMSAVRRSLRSQVYHWWHGTSTRVVPVRQTTSSLRNVHHLQSGSGGIGGSGGGGDPVRNEMEALADFLPVDLSDNVCHNGDEEYAIEVFEKLEAIENAVALQRQRRAIDSRNFTNVKPAAASSASMHNSRLGIATKKSSSGNKSVSVTTGKSKRQLREEHAREASELIDYIQEFVSAAANEEKEEAGKGQYDVCSVDSSLPQSSPCSDRTLTSVDGLGAAAKITSSGSAESVQSPRDGDYVI